MNIDSNLGIALFSKDLSGAAVIGDFQGMTNGVSENSEGSLFQQLISQMLTEKNNQMTEALGDNLNGGEKGKSGGIDDIISELLLAGGNLTKLRLQNAGTVIGESAETKDQSGKSVLTDENADSMEVIQALMAGLTAMPVSNTEKALPESQTGISTAEAPSEGIASVKTAINDLGMLETQKYIPSNPETESIPGEMIMPANDKTTLQDGNTDQTAFRSQMSSISNESLKSAANGESEGREAISGQEFKITETGTSQKTVASELQTLESITDRAEKPETETDGVSQDRMGFQNSMQGAVATSEVTETSPLTQPVEASEPYNQIREEILSKLEQKGSTEFRMQLDPEDLGQIDINLKLSEGKLVIDILAANSKTQALLTGQVDKLIVSMGLQNVQVESVHVSQQMNSQTQDNSQSQGYTMSSGMDFSQGRQQEHLQQEILNGSKLAGTFNLQQDEAQSNSVANRIQSIRYDSHRMDYAV